MSTDVISPLAKSAKQLEPLRVMVVDDSVVVRGLVSRWIDGETDLRVVGSLRNGQEAVNQIERLNPDIVILDIEMPELDGISALPLLLAKKRNLIVIMASTLTRRNAEISFKALALGASDYIPKPESARDSSATEVFRTDLLRKVRMLGTRVQRGMVSAPAGTASASADAPARAPRVSALLGQPIPAVTTRPFGILAPRVLLIGSSTGGPQALMALVSEIGSVIDQYPVLITQHMPPTFTTILAEHLTRASKRPAHEGIDGEAIKPGNIYLAPGGKHMRVVKHGGIPTIALDDGPPVNYCKPAVDPLFTSAIDCWQGSILAVILTGMGSDGTGGGRDIVRAGGSVIAQDEASSVVWGMPGAAAHAGICSAIMPLKQIGSKIVRIFSGDRP